MQLRTAIRWMLALTGTAAAAAIFSSALTAHLRSACDERDTPYLPICPEPSKEPEAVRAQLRARIERNPGDAYAWEHLLSNESQTNALKVLRGAAVIAPHHPHVARWRAAQALQQGNTPEAVDLLVGLVQDRSAPESAQMLAQLAATKEGIDRLRTHMKGEARWLGQVLWGASKLKMPPSTMLPLVAEAVQRGVLTEAGRRSYMSALKSSGNWLDAYGLWLAQHKNGVPVLYNGGFDQPFEPDGFDWEYAPAPRSRTGVVLALEPVARRGTVLDLEFTGRSFTTPIVRQYVFAMPGKYHLHGEYSARKLRSEGGLAWSVLCTGGRKALAGRTMPLEDTGGVWKTIELDFTIPPDCGAVASLQLEPAVALEAQSGFKGRVAFDAFTLERGTAAP